MVRPPGSALFPYTTLFRSAEDAQCGRRRGRVRARGTDAVALRARPGRLRHRSAAGLRRSRPARGGLGLRSEEHTSELQSHVNLVCRLLLEKKKTDQNLNTA